MRVIFGSVVYPEALVYMADFIESLNRQTYKDFLLLIINDGGSSFEIERMMSHYNNDYVVVDCDEKLTPAEIRVQLLLEANERNCHYIVLGDIDDWFSENRIERVMGAFTSDDVGFVYNDLLLENHGRVMPLLPQEIVTDKEILDYNFLGLSNTAIDLRKHNRAFIEGLSGCLTHVFDWYLFSRLLLAGQKGIFASGAITYYRIHANNYAGVPKLTKEKVDREVHVKMQHYKVLSNYDAVYADYLLAYENGQYSINKQEKYYWWNLTRKGQ